MAMKIFQSTIFDRDASLYFDRDLMQVLDSHQEYFKKTGNVTYREIPKASLENYRGDFFAILVDFEIPPKYHRLIMLLNGLRSPTDYSGEEFPVLIPDIQVIDQVTGVYQTGKSRLRLSETQR